VIVLPPFNAFLFVAGQTLDGLRHAWVLIVNRCPVATLLVVALGLIAFWYWILLRALPGLCQIIMSY
jgi:hypothetical protein